VEGSNTRGSNESPAGSHSNPSLSNQRSRAKCQGAMSQQGYGAHGNECYPQNMVQLIGYRDPRALAEARAEASERLKLKRSLGQAAE
jgi:hypothetical protein